MERGIAGQRVKVTRLDNIDRTLGRRIGDTGTLLNGGPHPTVIFDRPELGMKLMMADQLEEINETENLHTGQSGEVREAAPRVL